VTDQSQVVVRYWAAAKAAVGSPEESYPSTGTLAGLLEAIRERHADSPRVAEVLLRCSYLVDEVSPGRRAPEDVEVPGGAVVDVLPPFAGGSGTQVGQPRGTSAGREGLARP